MTKENWREIAKESERDPKVITILEDAHRSLGKAYILGATRYKYGQPET